MFVSFSTTIFFFYVGCGFSKLIWIRTCKTNYMYGNKKFLATHAHCTGPVPENVVAGVVENIQDTVRYRHLMLY